MKKLISLFMSIVIFFSFPCVYAASSINSDCELGFIFTTDGKNSMATPDEYSGIIPISEELNIYYATDAEALNAIENQFNIINLERDFKVEIPEDETALNAEIYANISLFSAEDSNDISETDNIPAYTDETLYSNDPLLERQWYYEAVKGYAFRNNDVTGKGVKVGIIDTGLTKEFKTFHDFEDVDIKTGVNVAAYIEQSRPGHEDENRLELTDDNGYHGTAIASIICAKSDNEHGIAGLVDGCTVIPYKIEDVYYAEDSNWLKGSALMRAIELAYQDDCDVVNISQGGDGTFVSNTLNMIINNCIKNGMIIVAGSGNSGKTTNDIEYPAACDNVIGVGGVEPTCDEEDAVIDGTTGMVKPESEFSDGDTFLTSWFKSTVQKINDNDYKKTASSTANESVFVCAPGISMTVAYPSSITTKDFNILNGTSFAAPIVAAAAAGVKQMRPYVDTDMFKEILMATAVDLEDEGYDINTGYGMVNFQRIYDYVSQMPLTTPERTPNVAIDYENEQLTGFPINREYTVNGETVTLNDDFSLPIKDEWFGTTVSIVKKASSDSYEDSEPQLLHIPARAELPDTVYATETGIANESDEVVLYKPVGGEEWIRTNSSVLLTRGKYLVKAAGTASDFESTEKELYVGKKEIEIEINYKDETLVGFEDGENYAVNGQDISISNNAYPIDEALFGTTVTITRKALNFNDEDTTQELYISARPETPNIILFNDNTVSVASGIAYKEENSDNWQTNSADDTITLEPGKTYVFKVQYTDNSFASEIREITVKFADIEPTPTTDPIQEEYDIETDISYDRDTGECVYIADNNTGADISAVGIIAVYGQDGVLSYIETLDEFPADGIRKALDFTLADGDTVRFFVWDSLQSMKPRDKVKLSEYTV